MDCKIGKPVAEVLRKSQMQRNDVKLLIHRIFINWVYFWPIHLRRLQVPVTIVYQEQQTR